jgi:hypothetical protein
LRRRTPNVNNTVFFNRLRGQKNLGIEIRSSGFRSCRHSLLAPSSHTQ